MNINRDVIELGDVYIYVLRKKIKNIHLSVHPPRGRVTISAPSHLELNTLRLFSISKLGWIRKQQLKLLRQKREMPREYISRESHYYLGKRYLLKVIEQNTTPKIVLKHSTIELYIHKTASTVQKENILHNWYRNQLKKLAPQIIVKYEKKIGVNLDEVSIRKMKTKWGSCNIKKKKILLNTELAKKPMDTIEYVIVHEMVHLLENGHNDTFITYMDTFLPKWRYIKEELNRLPLGHVDWSY